MLHLLRNSIFLNDWNITIFRFFVFKGLKEKYIKYYGERYNCAVPNYESLYKVFTNECDKYGILYNMRDIIKHIKKK